MGITIFYRGSLDDIDQIPAFEKMVKDWVVELGGTYQVYPPERAGESEKGSRRKLEEANSIRGIIASMHPNHEPLSLLVSPYGHLTSLFNVALQSQSGSNQTPPEGETCFLKTQFGTVESHVAVIQLLNRIKTTFCSNLYVNDESGYWENRNLQELEQKLGFLRSIVTQFNDSFKQYPLNSEAAEDPEIIIERLKRIAGKIQQDVTQEGFPIEIEVVTLDDSSIDELVWEESSELDQEPLNLDDMEIAGDSLSERTLESTEPTAAEIQQEMLFRKATSDQIGIHSQIQSKMADGLSFDDALRQTLVERGLPPPVYASEADSELNSDLKGKKVPIVELSELIRLVDPEMSELGDFKLKNFIDLPNPYNDLLAHDEHMTVTVEAFHGCSVEVEVLRSWTESNYYMREILLKRSTDKAVIQYGIVRLRLDSLEENPRNAILSEKIPLGKVLIEHNVLRNVELVELWEISMGPRLAKYFDCSEGTITFGRTAMIYFNDQPALELVEIVRPETKAF